ncbi:MAG: xerD 1 [Gemmataceae bacterium]|nr:xerD 1 [Gemmataceae bacterium]
MAHLVRQKITYYVDVDGRRVPKGTPGAKKVRGKSAKWYGQGIPGFPPKKRVPLATDKTAAQRMLDDLVRRTERGQTTLPDRDAGRRPLTEYLPEFETDVSLGLAAKGGKKRRAPKPRQVRLVVQRVRDVLAGCALAYPTDLNADAPAKVAKYLQGRARMKRAEGGVSAQTADFILAATRRFARWISTKAAVRPDLFDGLPGFDPHQDRKHARRDVPPDELARVLESARDSTVTVRNLTGIDRYNLYLVAFGTGFRAGELAALEPVHFHLHAEPPAVSLPAKVAKNKKAVRFPLAPGVAVALRSYLTSKSPGQPIWPGMWYKHAAKMLRVDLAAAKVPYMVQGPNGPEYADFHALRHTFCSALAAAGMGAKELQTLARHSDPRLTLGLYTHARTGELAQAIGRLAIPTVVARGNPLAGLTRDELEGVALGLMAALGIVLGRTPLTPPLTPNLEIPGDYARPIETPDRGKATD